MKKQPYPIVDLTGGLNVDKDPTMLLDKESPASRNIRFSQGVLKKDVGFDEFIYHEADALDGTVMFIDTFFKRDGSQYLLIITTKWIYECVNIDVYYEIGGQGPGGGWIFYLDDVGHLAYEAAVEDQTSTTAWITGGDTQTEAIGATAQGTDIGDGSDNTDAMVADDGYTGGAAKYARDYAASAVDAWYLPSIDELHLMYINLYLYDVGGMFVGFYWSSSEYNAAHAWFGLFGAGDWYALYSFFGLNKANTMYVRAMRDFTADASLYALRSVGPSGGYIFYKSAESGMITYYEAAPSDETVEFTGVAWSNIVAVAVTGTGTTIGTGSANTDLIVAQADHTTSAAKDCLDAEYHIGSGVWSLPSKDELIAMYDNLHVNGIGGFTAEFYWSSSESSTDGGKAWAKTFLGGAEGEATKAGLARVRSCYSFAYNPTKFIKRNTVELTGSESDIFSSATIVDTDGEDAYVLTNGIDPVMKWYGIDYFEDISLELIAGVVTVFKNRMFLADITDTGKRYPNRIAWSVLGEPEDFAGVGSGSIDLVDTPDWAIKFVVISDKLFLFKERSIWEIAYVGGTTYFLAILKLDGVGSVAANSVMSLGEDIIFFGNDNIYLYDGIALTPIADQLFTMLYDTEMRIINATTLDRISAIYIEELEEYWISIPTEGASPSMLFKYNFKYKSWTIKDITNLIITALGYYSVKSKLLWSDLTGTWNDQNWIWMNKTLPAGAPTTLIGASEIGASGGRIYEDDRITRDNTNMYFETKDFMFAHAQRWCELRAEVKGGDFSLRYSTDCGETWSVPRNYTASEDSYQTFVMYLNVTSKSIRIRLDSTSENLTVKWIEPWYIVRTRQENMVASI